MNHKILQYKIIYDVLKKEIEQDIFKPGTYLPSEKEISERFQVDRTTVRKSLGLLVEDNLIRKKPGLGSIVLAKRSIPQERLYKPVLFLFPKSLNKVDRITQPYYSHLFYYIEKNLETLGFSIIYSTVSDVDSFTALIETSNISGILFITNVPASIIDKTLEMDIPVLVINNYNEKIISITASHFRGAYMAVEHLIKLGHKRFGFITGFADYYTTRERKAGALKALHDNGLDIGKPWIVESNWQFDGGYLGMQALLENNPRATAVFCFNDTMALGALQALQDHKIKVPDEISVVGFDNIQAINDTKTVLTTIDVHLKETARITANMLITLMDKLFHFPMKIEIPTSLIEGNTSAEARG